MSLQSLRGGEARLGGLAWVFAASRDWINPGGCLWEGLSYWHVCSPVRRGDATCGTRGLLWAEMCFLKNKR